MKVLICCVLALAVEAAGIQLASAPPPAAPAPSAQSLYQRAREDLSAEPDALRGQLQARLAVLEASAFPARARVDATAAFNAALSYDPPLWDSQRGFGLAAKQIADRQAITALALSGDLKGALSLIPRADTPHASLYDTLLSIRGSSGGSSAPLRIVQACLQETSQFPFQGVAHVLARQSMGAGGMTQLVLQGVSSIEGGVKPEMFQFATLFLTEASATLPAANDRIEDAVVALLATIAADQAQARQSMDRLSGGQLLDLLAGMDPTRAAESRVSYPQFDRHVPSILAMGFLGPLRAPTTAPPPRREPISVSALRHQAASASSGPERVRLLLAAADAELQAGDVRGASADVSDAAAAWEPAMPVNLGIRLGSDLRRVGLPDHARQIFGSMCDHLAQALAFDQTHFSSDTGLEQTAILRRVARGDGAPAAEAFAAIARVDFALAARKALALPPGYGTSLVVAAVAASAPDPGRPASPSRR